jgi:hypothetical protein
MHLRKCEAVGRELGANGRPDPVELKDQKVTVVEQAAEHQGKILGRDPANTAAPSASHFWVEFLKKRKGKGKKSRYVDFELAPGEKISMWTLDGFSEMQCDESEEEEDEEEADEKEGEDEGGEMDVDSE